MDPINPDQPIISSGTSSSDEETPRSETNTVGANETRNEVPENQDAGGNTRQDQGVPPLNGGSQNIGSAQPLNQGANQLNDIQRMLVEILQKTDSHDTMIRNVIAQQELHSQQLEGSTAGPRSFRRPAVQFGSTRLHFTPESERRRQDPRNDQIPESAGNTGTATAGSNAAGARNVTSDAPLHGEGSEYVAPRASMRSSMRRNESETVFQPPRFDPSQIGAEGQGYLTRYLEHQSAEIQRMSTRIHKATSAAPEIDRLIDETRQTPFTDRIAYARVKNSRKYRFPQYDGKSDPRDFIKSFRLAMQTQVPLTEEEEDPAYCRFFAENLTGTALEWFMDLDGNTIDSFEQLIKAFIGQFSTLVKVLATEADLWKLKQKIDEPLKAYIDRFKAIRTKIPCINHRIAIDALRYGLIPHSHFGRDLSVHHVYSIDDALHRATKFAIYEEEESAKEALPCFQKTDPHNPKSQGKKHPPKDNKTTGEHSCAVNDARQKQVLPASGNSKPSTSAPGTPSGPKNAKFRPYDPNKYCAHHERAGHSTEECAEVKKQLAAKFAAGELKNVELNKKLPLKRKRLEKEPPTKNGGDHL